MSPKRIDMEEEYKEVSDKMHFVKIRGIFGLLIWGIDGQYIEFHDNDPIYDIKTESTNKGNISTEKNAQ